MLVQNNYIKVIDFGTAKRFGEDDQTLVEYGNLFNMLKYSIFIIIYLIGMLANTFIGTVLSLLI
jgi:hypothetical protein